MYGPFQLARNSDLSTCSELCPSPFVPLLLPFLLRASPLLPCRSFGASPLQHVEPPSALAVRRATAPPSTESRQSPTHEKAAPRCESDTRHKEARRLHRRVF